MWKTIQRWWSAPSKQEQAIHETLDLIGWITTQTWLNTRKIMNDLSALEAAQAQRDAVNDRIEKGVKAVIVDMRNLAEAVLALRSELATSDKQLAIDVLKEKAAASLARTNAFVDALEAADAASDAVLPDPVVVVEPPVVVVEPPVVVTEPAASIPQADNGSPVLSLPDPVVNAPEGSDEPATPVGEPTSAPAPDAPASEPVVEQPAPAAVDPVAETPVPAAPVDAPVPVDVPAPAAPEAAQPAESAAPADVPAVVTDSAPVDAPALEDGRLKG